MAKAKVCVITASGKRVCGTRTTRASGAQPASTMALLYSGEPIRTRAQAAAIARWVGRGVRFVSTESGANWRNGELGIELPDGATTVRWGVYAKPSEGYRPHRLANPPYEAMRALDRITGRGDYTHLLPGSVPHTDLRRGR